MREPADGEYGIHVYVYPRATMKRGCKEEGKREWGRERAESASRRVDCRPSVFVIRNLIIFQLTSATTCTGSRDVRSSVLYPTTWNARWFVASPVLYPVRHLCSPIAYTLASPSSFDHRYLDNFIQISKFLYPFFYLFFSFSFLHFYSILILIERSNILLNKRN